MPSECSIYDTVNGEQNTYGFNNPQEPIDQWTNLEGHNLLEMLYKEPKRWSFLFQSYVQLTRLNIHLQPTSSPVKLIERSLQNNRLVNVVLCWYCWYYYYHVYLFNYLFLEWMLRR